MRERNHLKDPGVDSILIIIILILIIIIIIVLNYV